MAKMPFECISLCENDDNRSLLIGVISDTHGLVRPELFAVFQAVDHIIHAGDIGACEVLEALRSIAPVSAVRGNMDQGEWAYELPMTHVMKISGSLIHVIHDIDKLQLEPAAVGAAVVVSGHSHRPLIIEREGVIYLNPGSAGPRRFSLPVSVGLIEFGGQGMDVRLLDLEI